MSSHKENLKNCKLFFSGPQTFCLCLTKTMTGGGDQSYFWASFWDDHDKGFRRFFDINQFKSFWLPPDNLGPEIGFS